MPNSYSVKSAVEIPLKNNVNLQIFAESGIEKETILELNEDEALVNGEEAVQLLEGASYEYELPEGYFLFTAGSSIVRPSRVKRNRGRITPNIYVGRLLFRIRKGENDFDKTAVEIRSIKAEYRSEYRKMLEEITEECTELLMIHSSPVSQRFTVDHEASTKTIYQRFAFVKSIVDSDDFRNAVHRVISMPVTAWSHLAENQDIRRSHRITPAHLRQFASCSDRVPLPKGHPLKLRMESVPSRLSSMTKVDTVDTPENRFVKHALLEFRRFCVVVCRHLEDKRKESLAIYQEALALEKRFGEYLNHGMFREVSRPDSLSLNSPILQRNEGYREILRVWLMFDLAAKLCWNALEDDQYPAGKRDVATLYEYWLFFKLLHVVQEIFSIDPKETKELIQPTEDGLGLKLKTGKHIAIAGEYQHKGRRLKVKFHYNRTFHCAGYPVGGSWAQPMRPDYTLSLWPADFTEEDAEEQELIVHIHFDAKYKVEGLKYLVSDNEQDHDGEKLEQKEGIYKRADLLKMHSYKDAIRRTAGAYVLYPGTTKYARQGFHEIIPGLGAFPVSPSIDGYGLKDLRAFIKDVVEHFSDRASRREELSYHTYDINRQGQKNYSTHEVLPEKYRGKRIEPLAKMTVLIGYYNVDQYDWICKHGLYNIRIDKKYGLAKYGKAETGACFLLLHGPGKLKTGDIWRIIGSSPMLMGKTELMGKGYPRNPSRDYYLVYEITRMNWEEFNGVQWDVRQLPGYTSGYGSVRPFAVTLQQLIKVGDGSV